MKRLFLLFATFVACVGLQAQATYTTIDDFESGSTNATVLWSGAAAVVNNSTGTTGSKVLQVTDNAGYPFVNIPVSFESGKTWTDYDGIQMDIYPKTNTVESSGAKAVGVDLSLLKAYENAGVTYKDASGSTISDVITWLGANKGVNYVRIRLFVDPTSSYAQVLAGGSSYMNQLGGDLATVKVLGKRVKDAGLKFLLDIQYSDGWADPAKQVMPASWVSTCNTQAKLQNKVYSYTTEVLTELKNYGATPDMVQIGNEITYGMFFTNYDSPTSNYSNSGTINYSSTSAGSAGIHCFVTYWSNSTYSGNTYWTNLCNVIKKGCQAVREVCPDAKIMLHTERSAYTTKCTASGYTSYYMAQMFYKKMADNGVDYDVIGLSYYPEDHGVLSNLNTVITALEGSFPTKEIMLAEYGYSNNWARGSNTPGTIGYYKKNDQSSSCPLAQKEFISALITQLRNHSKVTGMFYWFPEENESSSSGPYASGWRNSGLWANSSTNYASNLTSTAYSATAGRALPALDVLADFQDAGAVVTKSAYYAQTWLKFYDEAGTASYLHKKVGLNTEDEYGVDFTTNGLGSWYTVKFGFRADSIASYISAVGSTPSSINLELRNYTNPSETNNDFYLDNIRFYKNTNESYALDFEDGTINSPSSSVSDAWCTGSQVVKANPSKSGINTSDKVMTVSNTYVEGCALYTWSVALPSDLSLYDSIYIDVYPTTSTSYLTLQFDDGSWTKLYDGTTITSWTANAWNRLKIALSDLSDLTATHMYFGMWESGYSIDNITFHAKPATTYTVTWNATTNGGTCATASTVVNEGDPIGTLPTATKTGYTFKGWYTQATGGTQITASSVPTGDVTYYAQFTINSHTLTVVSNNATYGSVSGGGTYNYGTSHTITATANTGYAFSYWQLNSASVSTSASYSVTMPDEDVTYTAIFVPGTVSYTVKHYQQNAAANGYDLYETETKTGTTGSNTAASSKTYTGFTAQSFSQTTIAADGTTVVNIYYNRNTYTITYKKGQYGTGSDVTDTKLYGVDLTLRGAGLFTRSGYQQTGWSTNNKGNSKNYDLEGTYTANSATTLYPYWAQEFTVTFNANGHGTAPASQTVLSGAKATEPTAPTATGYTFGGWYKEAACTNAWNFSTDVVTANTTLYAKWTAITYTITWKDDDGSTIDQTTVAYGEVPTHADPTKAATAQYTYTFSGWTPEVVAVTGNATYTATYTSTVNQYTLTVNGGSGSGTYDYGTLVTITATPADNYHFTKWSDNVMTASRQVTVTANATYTALSEEDAKTTIYLVPSVWTADNAKYAAYVFEDGKAAAWSALMTQTADGKAYTTQVYDYANIIFVRLKNTATSGNWDDKWNQTADLSLNTATYNCYQITGWGSSDGFWRNYPFYYVEFQDFDGTVLKRDTVDSGNAATAPTAPTRTGYTFSGWDNLFSNVTTDLTVTAQYTPNTNTAYTVRHMWQNIDDNGYTLHESEAKTGTTGTQTAATAKTYTGFTAKSFSQAAIAADGNTVVDIYYDRKTYTITWKDGDNNTIETDLNVKYGATPSYDGATPTKTATEQYTYTFAGWSPAIEAVVGDATYTATYTSTINKYTITWKDDDGTVIDETEVAYGATPVHADPHKDADAQYTYTFAGWSPEVVAVTGNATYTATYTSTVNNYTITWKNDDGSIIDQTTVPYGNMPAHADASKANTAQYTYTFAGWSPALAVVTGNATYTATYTSTVNQYTITWKMDDGTVIDETEVAYGATPTHPAPTKAADAQYTYTFARWNPAIVAVVGDATYTAVFTASTNTYTVSFNANGHGTAPANQSIAYGNKVTQPTMSNVEGYTFGGWYKEAGCVNAWHFDSDVITGDIELFAKWTINAWTLTWNLNGGTIIGTGYTPNGLTTYGTPLVAPTVELTGYTFAGWSPAVNATMPDKNITYTATWAAAGDTHYTVKHYQQDLVGNGYTEMTEDEQDLTGATGSLTAAIAKSYTGFTPLAFNQEPIAADGSTVVKIYYDRQTFEIKFVSDGNDLKTDVLRYGATPTPPADPTKAADAQYTYTFTGWSPSIETVTKAQTYTAVFTQTVNKYTITWKNDDGSVIDETEVAYGATPTHAAPTKAADAQYTYTFAGWSPAIVAVVGDATYTATYTSTVNKYTITWKDDDGSIIDETEVAYGATPTHADPHKDADAQYTYTFAGWSPEVVAVTGNATYTATYTSTVNNYTITWKNDDGSIIDQTTVPYGNMPAHADASKANTAQYTYTFAGWSPALAVVTGNATYTATYTSTVNQYTITWKMDDGTVIDETEVAYGATPTHAVPTKAADAQYTYTFAGWTPAIVAVVGDATYTAVFNKTKNTFGGITFSSSDETMGTVTVDPNKDSYEYGDEVTITPIANEGYDFMGWSDGSADSVRVIVVDENTESVTAIFVPSTNTRYTVKHWQQDLIGTGYSEIATETKYGTTGQLTDAKANEYEGFNVKAFNQETIAANGNTVVDIYYDRKTFTITWVNGDNQTIETDMNVRYGATPEYNGATPTKTADAQYTYTFAGTWAPELETVTADQTYVAQFNHTTNTYGGFTFSSSDETMGTVTVSPEKDAYDYGETVTVTATANEGYEFAGWSDGSTEGAEREVVIDENTESFSAIFTPKKYLITFVNWDGVEQLQSSEEDYGTMPEYKGEAPTKPEDDENWYVFDGWDPALATVTAATTYTAVFRAVPKSGGTGLESVVITESGISGPKGMRIYDYTGKDVTNAMDHLYQGTYIIVLDGKTKKVMIP